MFKLWTNTLLWECGSKFFQINDHANVHSLRWFAFSVWNPRVDHSPAATAASAQPTRDYHAGGDGEGYPYETQEEEAAGSCFIGCLV